jgi:Na+/proline symporter
VSEVSDTVIILGMMAIFYAIVIYILYATMQTDKPTFDEYAVGGRRYGPVFIGMSYVQSWFPGAMFTAFFGIGAGLGIFMFYGLAYSLLGVTVMYFMANRAWRWGQHHDLRSQPDLLGLRYASPWVKIIASIIGIVAIMPWVILGMQSLAVLFRVASNGSWSLTVCLLLGLAVILGRQYWTVRMGMRGLIMTDMLQGTVAYLVSALVMWIILADPSGPAPYSNLASLPEAIRTMPGDGGSYGSLYVFSLIFMGTVGALCWPMSFQRIFTASGVRSVKKGTVYAIAIAAIFYISLTLLALAAATIPEVMANPQGGWFVVLDKWGGTWAVGLGCVMVLAAAMGHVDGSVQVCGTQIANDLVNRRSKPLSDHQLTVVAKTSMVIYMLIAGVLSYVTFDMSRLQLLAQMSYYAIIQLAVPLFLGIFWRGGNKFGAIAGMLSGFSLAIILTLKWDDDIPFLASVTAGVVALAVNLVVFLVVSALTGQSAEETDRVTRLFNEARRSLKETAPAASPVPVMTNEALAETPVKS